ncbi:hypothetical protein ACQEU3_23945 [Spirillospora sp. CA-253888]
MTAVVLVGDLPTTNVIPTPTVRVPDSAAPDALALFLDHTAEALRQRGAVLMLYPAWRSAEAVRMLRHVRGVLNSDRIAGVPVDLPPLALSILADQLTFIAPHVRAGVLASVVQPLARRIYAGAWLNSVAKFERARTGFGQHMFSYVPRTGFVAVMGEQAVVHRVTSSQPLPRIDLRPVEPVLMYAADAGGNTGWLRERLQPELRVASLTLVAGQPLASEYWGTKKYTEFAAFSGHPQDMPQALQEVRHQPCPWCGEPVGLEICPFCTRVQPRDEATVSAPAPTAPVPAPMASAPAPMPAPTPAPPAPTPSVPAPPMPAPTPPASAPMAPAPMPPARSPEPLPQHTATAPATLVQPMAAPVPPPPAQPPSLQKAPPAPPVPPPAAPPRAFGKTPEPEAPRPAAPAAPAPTPPAPTAPATNEEGRTVPDIPLPQRSAGSGEPEAPEVEAPKPEAPEPEASAPEASEPPDPEDFDDFDDGFRPGTVVFRRDPS